LAVLDSGEHHNGVLYGKLFSLEAFLKSHCKIETLAVETVKQLGRLSGKPSAAYHSRIKALTVRTTMTGIELGNLLRSLSGLESLDLYSIRSFPDNEETTIGSLGVDFVDRQNVYIGLGCIPFGLAGVAPTEANAKRIGARLCKLRKLTYRDVDLMACSPPAGSEQLATFFSGFALANVFGGGALEHIDIEDAAGVILKGRFSKLKVLELRQLGGCKDQIRNFAVHPNSSDIPSVAL
jgi:hypothetical protein